MADTAAVIATRGLAAPAFSRSRLKLQIYKTADVKVTVEDEKLNVLVVKIKSLSQDEVVVLATGTFD